MHSDLVSDEVWQRLDPRAARLTRRGRRGVVAALAAVVLLATVVAVGFRSGLIAPRVTVRPIQLGLHPATHTYDERVRLTSSGWIDQHVSSAYVRMAGHGIDGKVSPGSFTVPHGASITVRVTVYVHDCARVPQGEVSLHLFVHRFWGDMKVTSTAQPAFEGPMPHGPAWAVCHRLRH